MNIKQMLKTKMFYIRTLSILAIVMSFIPFCNPITVYDESKIGSLVQIMGSLGTVIKYFSTQIPGFLPYSNTLFILSVFIYVGLTCLLFGFLLTLSHDKSYKSNGITAILCSSALLFVIFATLGIIYFNINLRMYAIGTVAVYRKLLIVLRIPVFLYVFTAISFALLVLSAVLKGFSFSAVTYVIESYFSHKFRGGIHPEYNKVTRKMAIEKVVPSKIMVYPLSQHIGAECKPLVKVGDKVAVGQRIADADEFVSAAVHTTVSGTVIRISPEPHPSGNTALAIVVENDFEDTQSPELKAHPDYTELTTAELLDIIEKAGVTGRGGASFPTHVKIRAALNDKVDTLIINAAECEPYLSSDNRLILENTDELIGGIKILCKILGLKTAYIGIESNKPRAIKKLNRATHKTHIKVEVLRSKYPQGGEKQLIKAICNRSIATGKHPSSVGCAIFNVDTVSAIYRAVVQGLPLMRRIVTVAGSGVQKPGNYYVRLGTSFEHLLTYCGLKDTTKKIIMGGPMMGTCQSDLSVPVVKATTGILCFTDKELKTDAETSCIRCGSCVEVCPMHLIPSYIAMYAKQNDFEKCEKLNARDCIQCGCCSYTCPAKIPLSQYTGISKQMIKQKEGETI